MQIVGFFLAQGILARPDGYFAIGQYGVRGFYADAFPLHVPASLKAIVELRFAPGERGELAFDFRILGPDESIAHEERGDIPFDPAPDPHYPERFRTAYLEIELTGFRVSGPGLYRFEIRLNDEHLAWNDIGFHLRAQPEPNVGGTDDAPR